MKNIIEIKAPEIGKAVLDRKNDEIELKFDFSSNCSNSKDMALFEMILKETPLYAFIGGMFYTCDKKFSLDKKLNLAFPFTSYYKTKPVAVKRGGRFYRSLIDCKLPIAVLQFDGFHIKVEFEPLVKLNGHEAIPFISFDERCIEIRLFSGFRLISKDSIWMGIGAGRGIEKKIFLSEGTSIKYDVRIKKSDGLWDKSVRHFLGEKCRANATVSETEIKKYLEKIKTAFRRAYDSKLGCFLQLPWKDRTGFALSACSYTLPTYESERMNIFHESWKKTGDSDYLLWSENIEKNIFSEKLSTKGLKSGRGRIWHEMTHFNGKDLEGFFYMDCGYCGYPGGQATICRNLIKRICETRDEKNTEKIKKFSDESLEYILSTQKKNGGWPAALRQSLDIKPRFDNFERLESEGATGECARALIAGYKATGRKELLEAAIRGLKHLSPENGACFGKNSLRDIGADEIEGMSSIYIVHAFLDAYELMKNEEYKEMAILWASYLLTWMYLWETEKLKWKWTIHPISQSITPRLSPYETVLGIEVFLRLWGETKDKFWRNLAYNSFNAVLPFVEEDGGLSECYFPDYLEGFSEIAMEQTFASAQLLKVLLMLTDEMEIGIAPKKGKKMIFMKNLEYSKNGEIAEIKKGNRTILEFDAGFFEIIKMGGADIKAGFLAYPFREERLFRSSRRFKFVSGLREAKTIFYGVEPPDTENGTPIPVFDKCGKSGVKIISENPLEIEFVKKSDILEASLIFFFVSEKEIKMSANIRMKRHDMKIDRFEFSMIGNEKISIESNPEIPILRKDGEICIDLSLMTNWTHCGNLCFEAVFKSG